MKIFMKKLILIDGNAIVHRAYHALPPLTNKSGIVVNAVYGFFSMFLKILEDQKPDFIIVCFDRKAPTFRKEMFVGYQAKRPKMSDDLVPQVKFVHEILEKAKVCIFELDGYEADDLIGTIATQAVQKTENRKQKTDSRKTDKSDEIERPSSISSAIRSPSSVLGPLEVIIVSGDRDLLQLVNSHVKMIAPVTGLTNIIVYDQALVLEKFGIKPAQMVDYKALVGDASDNYPGVAGIGPKTAQELLNQYQTLEYMYEHLDKLPSKIVAKLSRDAEQAVLAKKLATIVTDAPITLDLEQCSMSKFSMEGARLAFEELGFKSLLKRLQAKGTEEPKETKGTQEAGGKRGKEKKDNQQLGLL